MFGEISNYLGEKIEYEVSDLFAYFNIIKKIKKNATLIYRGECQKYPSINGSIFREYNVKDIKIGLFKYQDLIIKEFYQEMASSIKDLDRQNFLAYSQHHGLPTSLIDVTHSPLVSLYFACCQGKDEDGYVYIFKRNDTINISEMIIINPYLNGDDLLYEHNEKFIVFVMNEIYESSFFPVEELLINLIEFIKNDSITPAYENSYSRIVRPLIKNTDLQTDNVRLLAEQWIHIFENDEGITSNLLSFLEKLKENKLFTERDNWLKKYEYSQSTILVSYQKYILWYFYLLNELIYSYKNTNFEHGDYLNKSNINFLPIFTYQAITDSNRIKAQSGEFIFQTALKLNIHANLLQVLTPPVQIKIDRKAKENIMNELDMMGINKKNLFGDPDSISAYLKNKYLNNEYDEKSKIYDF